MKKILIILLALGFLGAIIFGIYTSLNFKSAPVNSGTGNVTLPSSATVQVSSSGSTQTSNTIAGFGGTVIPTNDFLHGSSTGQYSNTGYYYLGYHTVAANTTDTTATNNPPYLISYIATTQYFNIELLQEPIGRTRSDAEQFLMTYLGIPQVQMCHLNYMVSVPDSINSQFAGMNLGFSFCPGATVLPK